MIGGGKPGVELPRVQCRDAADTDTVTYCGHTSKALAELKSSMMHDDVVNTAPLLQGAYLLVSSSIVTIRPLYSLLDTRKGRLHSMEDPRSSRWTSFKAITETKGPGGKVYIRL